MERKLIFSIGRQPVGVFVESDYPRTPGRYRYEPFRGPGHYKLAIEIEAGRMAQCYYDLDSERVYFGVVEIPEYGVLELENFQRFPEI